MPDAPRKVVEAEEYRLVDGNGKLRALITASTSWNGEPSISLFDDQGMNRIVVEMHNGAPRITFFAPSGQIVAGIGAHEDGGGTLALNRDNGTLGLYARAATNAAASMQLFDEHGQPITLGGNG